jgi:hypothetical protein
MRESGIPWPFYTTTSIFILETFSHKVFEKKKKKKKRETVQQRKVLISIEKR